MAVAIRGKLFGAWTSGALMQVNAASDQRYRMPRIERACELTCFSTGLLRRHETAGRARR